MNSPIVLLLVRWLVLALGVMLATRIVPGIKCDNGTTLVVVVLLLSFFNAILKPLLVLFTLPFILINSIETILAVSAFLFILLYLFGFAAVFALRQKEPDMPRPYRSWGYPWTTGIMFIGSLAFLIAALMSDTSNSLIAVVVLLTSYPVYRIFKWLNGRTDPAAA